MTALQHFAKNAVSVIADFKGSFGLIVIDPSKNNHLAACVVTKKQTVLLKKFGPEPMFVLSTQGVALAVLRASGVLGNGVKRQLGDGAHANVHNQFSRTLKLAYL